MKRTFGSIMKKFSVTGKYLLHRKLKLMMLHQIKQTKENLFYPFFKERIKLTVDKEQPENIGISIAYLSQAVPAFGLIGFIRAEFPGMKIILGGGLVTSWLRSPLWKNPFSELVDDCIAGP